MSRSRSVPALALSLLATGALSHAEALLDVSGSVVAVAPWLEVRVVVTNRGDRATRSIEITGELLGERRGARLAAGLAPGGSGAVSLDFAPAVTRPGLYALTLLLEHPLDGTPDAAGNPPLASQRAWLLLTLGASPGEAVRLRADPLSLDVRGPLAVHLESRDGEAHRVRLRVLPERGLRAEGEPVELDMPARGVVTTHVPMVRAGAARGSRHAALVVAETLDGPLARTSVAAAAIDVRADPSLLPRLRAPLLVAGFALLLTAFGFEIRERSGWRSTPEA